ncbi:hypothetical protein ES708_34153 [subsurface metagenome]
MRNPKKILFYFIMILSLFLIFISIFFDDYDYFNYILANDYLMVGFLILIVDFILFGRALSVKNHTIFLIVSVSIGVPVLIIRIIFEFNFLEPLFARIFLFTQIHTILSFLSILIGKFKSKNTIPNENTDIS